MKLFYLILSFYFLSITNIKLYSEVALLNSLERHTETINNIKYIEFTKIAALFDDNIQSVTQNEIKLKNKLIRVAPGSYFVFYENADEIKIAQLSSPAVEYRAKTYLPYHSLTDALIRKGIISINQNSNSEQDNNKLKILKIRNMYSIRTLDTIVTDKSNNTKISPDNKPALSREPLPPEYYYLPDNLIRNELESSKTK